MTVAERLARGREKYHARKRHQHKAALNEYLTWVRIEGDAYRKLAWAREMFGSTSDEAGAAHDDWLAALSMMPHPDDLPGDQRWRELEEETNGVPEHSRMAKAAARPRTTTLDGEATAAS